MTGDYRTNCGVCEHPPVNCTCPKCPNCKIPVESVAATEYWECWQCRQYWEEDELNIHKNKEEEEDSR